MATEKIIEIQPINVIHATVTIAGDGDLVLNKMNGPTIRQLIDARKDKAKKMEKPNEWEQVIIGLQGHKRLNRYESGKDRAQYIKLQNYALDMFGEILQPSWDYVVTAPEDIKSYLEGYVSWENSVYTRLADISNQLIVMGFPCEAKLVREGMPRKELEKVRRMLVEYGLSGWDMTYILQADKELHDRMKRKEEK